MIHRHIGLASGSEVKRADQVTSEIEGWILGRGNSDATAIYAGASFTPFVTRSQHTLQDQFDESHSMG